jgi:CBS domain-containing protein
MQAADIMTRHVTAVLPSATASEIAATLAGGAAGNVLVCDPDGTLLGIVSEDDLAHYLDRTRESWRGWWSRYLALGTDPNSLLGANSRRDSAWELMRTDLLTVGENTPVADVVETMLDHDISRVPVVRGGKLVGIVTRADLLKTMIPAHAELADA